jgi:hypothetical protein
VKRSLPLVLAPLLLLAACAERAPSEGSSGLGTVEGRVLLGPTCPVETEGSPCPDEPLAGEVVQLVAGDVVVASAVSDPQGRFSFEVEPGRYRLMWAPDEDVGIRFAKPVVVTVVAGRTVSVDLLIDTGIR